MKGRLTSGVDVGIGVGDAEAKWVVLFARLERRRHVVHIRRRGGHLTPTRALIRRTIEEYDQDMGSHRVAGRRRHRELLRAIHRLETLKTNCLMHANATPRWEGGRFMACVRHAEAPAVC